MHTNLINRLFGDHHLDESAVNEARAIGQGIIVQINKVPALRVTRELLIPEVSLIENLAATHHKEGRRLAARDARKMVGRLRCKLRELEAEIRSIEFNVRLIAALLEGINRRTETDSQEQLIPRNGIADVIGGDSAGLACRAALPLNSKF